MLPSDAEMVKLFHLGVKAREVAEKYGVTEAAVTKRWREKGLRRGARGAGSVAVEVTSFLQDVYNVPPAVSPEGDSSEWIYRRLKILMRRHLGDRVSTRQVYDSSTLAKTMLEEDMVAYYTREEGWHLVPREESDGNLMVRWPTDHPEPDPRFKKALAMPSAVEGPEWRDL